MRPRRDHHASGPWLDVQATSDKPFLDDRHAAGYAGYAVDGADGYAERRRGHAGRVPGGCRRNVVVRCPGKCRWLYFGGDNSAGRIVDGYLRIGCAFDAGLR